MKYTRVSYNLNWSVLGRDQEGAVVRMVAAGAGNKTTEKLVSQGNIIQTKLSSSIHCVQGGWKQGQFYFNFTALHLI